MVRITITAERTEQDGAFALESKDSFTIDAAVFDRYERLLQGWGPTNYLANEMQDHIQRMARIQEITDEG